MDAFAVAVLVFYVGLGQAKPLCLLAWYRAEQQQLIANCSLALIANM